MAASPPSPPPSNVKTTSKRSWPRVPRYSRGRRRFLGPPTGTSSRRCVPRRFMSKELVISAASHERRVAILEEGQLVEIYIEREKEFALVGSIYKGKVTRVLPGMQSAFVDIGLDGDAFLYVSDVFENLEDYDHDHVHDTPHAAIEAESHPAAAIEHEAEAHTVELLPGESLARAGASSTGESDGQHDSTADVSEESHGSQKAQANEHEHSQEHTEDQPQPGNAHEHSAHDSQPEPEERQPESNASAPQNFGPNYKSSQNYSSRGASGPGQNFGRGNDRGQDSGSNRGGGRFGRRGGRRRGGRPGPGGRNLPPSKYASPQGQNDTRGNDRGNEPRSQNQNRGAQPRGFEPRGAAQRGFDNRRPETPRQSSASPIAPNFDAAEEPILLPGESLAKYRGKPIAASSSPVVEQESSKTSEGTENSRPATGSTSPSQPAAVGGVVPRRFTGGLPRWLLADAGAESEAAPVSADENIGVADDSTLSAHGNNPPRHEASPLELPTSGSSDLNDDQIAVLGSGLVEAKQEQVQEVAQVPALAGDTIFEEEEEIEEEEDAAEEETEGEESHAEVSELTDDETAEVEEGRAANRAEAEADAAHESAEHHAALGLHDEEHAHASEHDTEHHEGHDEGHPEGTGQEETERATAGNVPVDNLASAASASPIAEDVII